MDCVECVSSGLLFNQVLSAFFGADAAALLPRCPSLSDFVRLYKQMSSNSPATQTRYIVSLFGISYVVKNVLNNTFGLEFSQNVIRLCDIMSYNVPVDSGQS